MRSGRVITVESTNEKPAWGNSNLTFQKITTENGNVYAWYSDKDIGTNWLSLANSGELQMEVEISTEHLPYNIVVIHNCYFKPMININRGNEQILRQEINRWEYRYLQGWYIDE